MKTSTVTCDCCGGDLTETGPMPRYRVVLGAESLPSNSNITYAVCVRPPVDGLMHFCDLGCIKAWLDGKTQPSSPKVSHG